LSLNSVLDVVLDFYKEEQDFQEIVQFIPEYPGILPLRIAVRYTFLNKKNKVIFNSSKEKHKFHTPFTK
jgi:hypothetical protein